MVETQTDGWRNRLNPISASVCSSSAQIMPGHFNYAFSVPSIQIIPNSMPALTIPRKLDTLTDAQDKSYKKLLEENKDVLMLLAE